MPVTRNCAKTINKSQNFLSNINSFSSLFLIVLGIELEHDPTIKGNEFDHEVNGFDQKSFSQTQVPLYSGSYIKPTFK